MGWRGCPDGAGWVTREEQFHGEVITSWDIIIMTVIMMMNLLIVSPCMKHLFCISHSTACFQGVFLIFPIILTNSHDDPQFIGM